MAMRLLERLLAQLAATAERPLAALGIGECSLDQVYVLPGQLGAFIGGKCTATAVDSLGGGQVATAMCALRRLGWPTAYCGAVGDDAAGAMIRDGLAAEGVATGDVVVVPGAATRSALLLIDADGERTVIEQRDPALRLSPLLPLAAQLATARVLHVDATHPELSLRTARRARELQAVVSIDVDLVAGKVSAAAAELCALADLCVVPAGLPEALTGESEPIAALQALSRHSAGLVVVTLGAEGCLAIADDKLYHQPALLPPGRLVDTTACGDTFRAALIAALLRCAAAPTVDDPLPAALRFACAAAALKCLERGRRGCPSLAAVDQFLLQDGASR